MAELRVPPFNKKDIEEISKAVDEAGDVDELATLFAKAVSEGKISAGTKIYQHSFLDETNHISAYLITDSKEPITNYQNVGTIIYIRCGGYAQYSKKIIAESMGRGSTAELLSITGYLFDSSTGTFSYVDYDVDPTLYPDTVREL